MVNIQESGELDGKLEKISMMEFRNRIGSIMQQVDLGKTFILTYGKNNKPVAVIQKLPADLVTVIESDGTLNYELAR